MTNFDDMTDEQLKREKELIERNISTAKLKVERYKNLVKLQDNKEYKSVILEGFIGELEQELFYKMTLPARYINDGEGFDSLKEKFNAIKLLKQYIGVGGIGDVELDARTADNVIEDETRMLIKLMETGRL